MNSKKVLTLVLTGLLALSSCGETEEKKEQPESKPETKVEDTSSQKEKEQVAEEEPKEEKQEEEKILGPDDEWVVDGQWKLKINSVTTTDQRNEYYEGEEPAQVVIVDYTFENIGYKNEFGDGLFLYPETAVDSKGNMAESYPATEIKGAKETPVGATMNNAQEAFALKEESDKIKLYFMQFDSNEEDQSVIFEIPIQ